MGTGGYLAWHHATTQFFKHVLQASSGLVRSAADSSACQPSDYFPSSSHQTQPQFGAQLHHDEHYLGHIVGPRMWSKVSSPLLLGRETSRVHIEPLSGVEDKYQRVRVRNCQYDAALTSFPAHDIVQRVLAQVRKVSCFRLFSNNCEHFATWARCPSNDADEQAVSRLHRQLQTLQDTLDFALLRRHNDTTGQTFTNADQPIVAFTK
eukprot:jgi/Chlat1/7494/Chrsp61S09144